MTHPFSSFLARLAARLFPLALGLAPVQGCVGDTDPQANLAPKEQASPEECEALRNILVGLRMQSVTADRAQHEANLKAALGPTFVASCQADLPRAAVLCGGAARDLESLAACSGR